jgi:hypothetical protein
MQLSLLLSMRTIVDAIHSLSHPEEALLRRLEGRTKILQSYKDITAQRSCVLRDAAIAAPQHEEYCMISKKS